ncbi:MAG: TPM domain-containing protein, partial [Paramuribaculum sp.]|nr:TPM domain-containing protein [Paramuribaculum sp.]
MKRILLVMALLTAAIATALAAYTPGDIPNVHLSDRTRYVSNPDGVLSPAAEVRLDSLLGNIWQKTSAEVVVVAVESIEGGDIDSFATELFTLWGIGKKDNDNGLLILIS